jgi:hypothetical protein
MLLPFLAACALSLPSGSPAIQENDAAWLVPPDSTILVRLESTRAWNELVRAFAPLAGDAAAQHDLQLLLDAMAVPARPGARSVPPRLDPARPLFFALTLDPSAGQFVTLVAPVVNGQPFRFQPTLGPTTNVVRGSYTGVSNRPGYAANTAPSALVAGLRPGLVSVHVELATLVAAYRPLVDMGLGQFETMLDQAPADDEVGLDVEPLMEAYLGAARALVDGAEALDLALARRGDELDLCFDYRQREERAPAAATADVTPLLGFLDPACSLRMVLNGKATDYLALFEEFTESVIGVYPEPLQSDVRRMVALVDELDPLLLPGLAAGFDFGAHGMHGTYVVRSAQPGDFQARIEEFLRTLDHDGGLLRVGEAEPIVAGGVEARVLSLEVQHEVLLSAVAEMSAPSGGLAPEAEQEFRATMETLYGRDLRLALVPRGELVALVLAGDEAELRADVARLATPAAADAKLARLLAKVEGGRLGFAYQLDFGRWMGQMFGALQGVLPAPGVAFPDRSASVGFWGSSGGRTWSGGTTLDLSELIGFVQAMQGF